MRQVGMAVAAALLSWALTGLVLAVARQRQHLALPTDRGLHSQPTPVGGGLGLISAALLVWALARGSGAGEVGALGAVVVPHATNAMGWLSAAIAALAALSWWDDRRPLPPALRFAAQIAVVVAILWLLPNDLRLVRLVPLVVERAALAFAWLWILNLTNFMDGIDGLAGVEAVSVGVGYALLAALLPGDDALHGGVLAAHLPDLALTLAAAAVGYLIWNWPPARIFMGDVGAIPLGFLFGLLMLDLATRSQWAAALILPLYFIADATTTLLDRLRRGAKPWQAHREHAYQRAVLAGLSHGQVTLHVALLNVALVALAVLSVRWPWLALLLASGLTGALLVWLRGRSPEAA